MNRSDRQWLKPNPESGLGWLVVFQIAQEWEKEASLVYIGVEKKESFDM
jgi:hypothetical protein